ncbi:carboxypeptidase S [Punctularia strigosozonata HHB-11173 SS5]|uniref:Carboxypeptidase S n=1 Tax=Punctularia strigosozonata (strain HHB-11173) TaxID=741275 RepID=R7S3A5_PUNST|nr:carboxypeptidase S [Punctularia strigosozonata HHB-11173 SS5]EIN04703.1 carboxypeptidase S [Punctularia strigosozonata HHB-11173 SS5]
MANDTKALLPQAAEGRVSKPAKWTTKSRVFFLLKFYWTFYVLFWLLPRLICEHFGPSSPPGGYVDPDGACPQVDALEPAGANGELWANLSALYAEDSYEKRAISWLSGAVRVPTETYDDMGPVGEDERWDTRGPFHEYLLEAFPTIHSSLKLTKVNTYGLLYEWPGTDSTLKPILLMGHQDVVPVNPDTVDQWAHPPYSGYFDGESIWGRGSSDDKSGLIAILATIETLLEHKFQPTRSIVLSFGFDEEAGGPQGAKPLAEFLLDKYGKDAFALIIDEGAGYVEQFGGIFATPGIGEKGSANVKIEIHTPGGHSSIPPKHTSIGMLSSLLVHLEANPFPVHLSRGTPVYQTLQCVAAHAPDVPPKLRRALVKGRKSDRQLRKAEEIVFENNALKALAGTTQAADIVAGGVKSNALPEQATALVNHRIATDSSLKDLRAHYPGLFKHLASSFNLSYTAFDATILDSKATFGDLIVSSPYALEPAPVTPTDADAKPYALLSGSIRTTYAKRREAKGLEAEKVFVAPGIMSGNTDTKYYWDLSKHIFRYNHHNQGTGGLGRIHTVNESMESESFLEVILFFTTLILNADSADL